MAAPMTGEEDYANFTQPPPIKQIRGRTERSVQLDLLQPFQPAHRVKSAAADYANDRFRHLPRFLAAAPKLAESENREK